MVKKERRDGVGNRRLSKRVERQEMQLISVSLAQVVSQALQHYFEHQRNK